MPAGELPAYTDTPCVFDVLPALSSYILKVIQNCTRRYSAGEGAGMPPHANACDRMRPHANAYDRIRPYTIEYDRIQSYLTSGYQWSPVVTSRDRLLQVETGCDGMPRHAASRGNALSLVKRYGIIGTCRQVGAAGGHFRSIVQKRGGDRMSDYEIIMIILTIITLLIAVDHKNKG